MTLPPTLRFNQMQYILTEEEYKELQKKRKHECLKAWGIYVLPLVEWTYPF